MNTTIHVHLAISHSEYSTFTHVSSDLLWYYITSSEVINGYQMTGVIFRLITQSTFNVNCTERMISGIIISCMNGNDKREDSKF